MKFFKKDEAVFVSIVLLVIFIVSFFNFRIAIRRSRDAQRRDDLGAITTALSNYKTDFAFVPPSVDNMILACKKDGVNFDEPMQGSEFDREEFFNNLRVCDWGIDGLVDISDDSYPPYISTLPKDPKSELGYKYIYMSSTGHFQVFAYLEGEEDEDQYNPEVVSRGLDCGGVICNYGRADGATPLNISIEEYEEMLLEKSGK
jgi:hypothetical protein